MTTKCWRVVSQRASAYRQNGAFVQGNGVFDTAWRRATTITTRTDTILSTDANPYYAGMLASFLTIDGVATRNWAVTWTITEDPNNAQCPVEPKYDCLNGQCVQASFYNTPGAYSSLSACQTSCGVASPSCLPPFKCLDPNNYCPPDKVCISQSEWTQIEGLAGQLKSKTCS